jgi:hypothetical protein
MNAQAPRREHGIGTPMLESNQSQDCGTGCRLSSWDGNRAAEGDVVRLMKIGSAVVLAALVAAGIGACGEGTIVSSKASLVSRSRPAPVVTGPSSAFRWELTADFHGRLARGTWTTSPSFTIAAGPVSLNGRLAAFDSRDPRFALKLVPLNHNPSLAGYGFTARGSEVILPAEPLAADYVWLGLWCRRYLPAGSYKVMMKKLGRPCRGSYAIWISCAF